MKETVLKAQKTVPASSAGQDLTFLISKTHKLKER